MIGTIHSRTSTARDPGRSTCAAALGLAGATACIGAAADLGLATLRQGVTAEHLAETLLQWVLAALLARLAWICAAAAVLCRRASEITAESRSLTTGRQGSGSHRAARVLLALSSTLIGATATTPASATPGSTDSDGSIQHTAVPHIDVPSPTFSTNPPPVSPSVPVPSPDFRPDDAPTRTASVTTHTVRSGDTLWGLARHGLHGAPPDRTADVLRTWLVANPQLTDPDRLAVGDVLHVPDLDEKGHAA